jgi:hypothetical protein
VPAFKKNDWAKLCRIGKAVQNFAAISVRAWLWKKSDVNRTPEIEGNQEQSPFFNAC